ncbi:hypothetical protein BC937DRAFT_95134, partial [Endogone sp. FLAS-F59071]
MHLQNFLLYTLLVAYLPIVVIHAGEVSFGKSYILFGTIPHSGRINPLHSLATELASRGHETAFFSMERGQYTSNEQADKKVQFVSLGNYSEYCNEDGSLTRFSIRRIFQSRPNTSKSFSNCWNPAYNEIVTQLHQSFQQKRPDLCIIDYVSIAYFDACMSLNITTIIMRPGFLLKAMHYVPPSYSGASIHSTFFQRLSWDFNQHIFQF